MDWSGMRIHPQVILCSVLTRGALCNNLYFRSGFRGLFVILCIFGIVLGAFFVICCILGVVL